jgi:hypothetical protein
MFSNMYMCEKLFSFVKRNKTQEITVADTHLSSIMKVISARVLKPEICIPAAR